MVAAFVLAMTMTAGAATIKAVKVKGNIPVDPSNLFWSERYGVTALKHVIIDMDPQMITNPMWPNPQTKYVFVKAATNGKEIAIHLEWTDPTRNDIMVRSQQYKDQAALMFPVNQSGEELLSPWVERANASISGNGKRLGTKKALDQLETLVCRM